MASGPVGRAPGVPIGGALEVVGTVKGQAVRASAVRLGEHDYEVLPRGTPSEAKDLEEVAAVLNRMVHAVAFQQAVGQAAKAVGGLEAFQRECWDRERAKDLRLAGPGRPKRGTGPPATGAPRKGHAKGKPRGKSAPAPSAATSALALGDGPVAAAAGAATRRAGRRGGRGPKEPRPPGGGAGGGGPPAAPGAEPPLDEALFLHPYLSLHRSHPQRGFEAAPGLVPPAGYRRPSADPAARDAPSAFPAVMTPAFCLEPGSEAFLRRLSELQSLCIETARSERRPPPPRGAPRGGSPAAAAAAAAGADSDAEEETASPVGAAASPTVGGEGGSATGFAVALPEALSSDKDSDESSDRASEEGAHP